MVQYLRGQWRLPIVGALLALLVVTVGLVGAADRVRIWSPDQKFDFQGPAQDRPVSAPPFWPGDESGYVTVNLSTDVHHPDGRQIGHFLRLPDKTEAIEAKFYPQRPADQSGIGFDWVASVRYRVSGHAVYVVTSQPTPATAQRPLWLGTTR